MLYSIIKNFNVGFGASVAATILLLCSASTAFGGCPAATVADMKGVKSGKYPQQFELKEFERLAGCRLSFNDNPDIAKLNSKIRGNPSNIPSVEKRLPEEPLVYAPYHSIGKYGGTLDVLSNATEAGTSDFLSVRHVNLVRFSDDLQTIVPNIAKDWKWNSDFTKLTFYLRKGHNWSDGHPFTSRDYMFWYNEIILNDDLFPVKPNWLRLEGELGVLDAPDDHTIRFSFSKSNGVILQWLASWTELVAGPPPSHYLKQYHPNFVNEDSLNAIVRIEGYDTWMALYEMKSNPFLNPDRPVICAWQARTGADASIFIAERNPYYWKVDTDGNQLPYIDRIEMTLVQSGETVTLKAIAGQIDMQGRRILFENYPLLREHREDGDYRIFRWQPATTGQGTIYLNQNYSHVDPVMSELL